MNHLDPLLPRGRRVAYALISGDDEIAFIADDDEVLTRVLVLQLVANTRPDQYPPEKIEPIRHALSLDPPIDQVNDQLGRQGR